jgi:hypothetical protein
MNILTGCSPWQVVPFGMYHYKMMSRYFLHVISYLLFTTALSSPGTTRSFSPTWTTPEQSLPATAMPDDVAVWPRKTFETGNRKGASKALSGCCSLSRARVKE